MKIVFFCIIICLSPQLNGQQYYSKTFSFFNVNQEEIRDFTLTNDTLVFRGSVFDCADPEKSCTFLGNYSISSDSVLNVSLLNEPQSGLTLISYADDYFLSSEERVFNQSITINRVGKNFDFKNSKDLKLPDTRYFSYTIKKSNQFGNRFVIGGQVLDSLDNLFFSGEWVYKEKATLFVVDSNFNIDTVLLISPFSGRSIKIEDMEVGPDSVLYISFFHEHYTGTYFEYIKVIYGFDKDFNQVFYWKGPDAENKFVGKSSILIGLDSTIYINYNYNYRTYLFALNQDGTKKWECPFDSTFIQGGFYGIDLSFAENGDIIGSGQIQSAFYDIGSTGFIFRIATNGVMKWNKVIRLNKGIDTYSNMKAFGHVGGFSKITELENKDIVVGGAINMFQGADNPLGSYRRDSWVVRTDSNGCIWKDCPYIQDLVNRSSYLPFVSSLNEWTVDFIPMIDPQEIRIYTFSQDSTLKNGKYYREFIYTSDFVSGVYSSGEFYREENGVVYKINGVFTGSTEREIYDFKAGVGDTLMPNVLLNQGQRKVIEVGAIVLLDGIPRKKIVIGGNNDDCFGNITLIEGMGDWENIYGYEALCTPILDSPDRRIRCFSTNGQLVYLRPDLQDCYTTSVNDLASNTVKVYPNPFVDKIVVKTDNLSSVFQIEFTDNLGRVLIFNDWILSDNGIELDISKLNSGFYFGTIIYKDGIRIGFKSLKT
jgi:Secretion system C-terminal sorting domain